MSSSFFIAVGGTGNKILESMVYACATGSLYELNMRKERSPLKSLSALIVDVDAACGNTTRAKLAAEHYEGIRRGLEKVENRRSFYTKLSVRQWTMNLAMRNASIDNLTRNAERDRLLAQTLFTDTESRLVYNEGFRGHPDLGVLFFADLLKNYRNPNGPLLQDEMTAFLAEIENAMNNGGAHVMLAGSIFGGTGASGIPMISRFLHERFGNQPGFTLSAILMLPYFNVPPSVDDETMEIVVKSSAFLDKARTALHYYGMENMIRKDPDDQNGVYDALYLLGLPKEAFVTARNYSTGSQSQQNEAHLLEWMAVRFAAHFYAGDFHGGDPTMINCYFYQWQNREAGWDRFEPEGNAFRAAYGGLLKAAALFMVECYPTLRKCLRNERAPEARLVNYWTAYFANTRNFTDAQRDELEKLMQEMYQFMAFYINWLWQIVHSMPPALCADHQAEANRTAMKTVYRELLDVRADTARNPAYTAALGKGNASAEAQQRLAKQLQKLIDTQEESTYLELLSQERDTQHARIQKQQEAIDTLTQKMDRWQHEDAHLTTPKALREAQDDLQKMEEVLAALQLRADLVREDTQAAAHRHNAGVKPAAVEETTQKNGYFDYELLRKLHELLEQYGNDPEERNLRDTGALRATLWKRFNHLVTQPMIDRVGAAKAVAGLGGGGFKAETPAQAFAGFTLTLIAAVMEGGQA